MNLGCFNCSSMYLMPTSSLQILETCTSLLSSWTDQSLSGFLFGPSVSGRDLVFFPDIGMAWSDLKHHMEHFSHIRLEKNSENLKRHFKKRRAVWVSDITLRYWSFNGSSGCDTPSQLNLSGKALRLVSQCCQNLSHPTALQGCV